MSEPSVDVSQEKLELDRLFLEPDDGETAELAAFAWDRRLRHLEDVLEYLDVPSTDQQDRTSTR
jgi:hypothetical protein